MEKCEWREDRPEWPRTKSLEDVLEQRLEPLGVPVLYKLPLGHGKNLATLPLGVPATLDADARTLTIDEPALTRRGEVPRDAEGEREDGMRRTIRDRRCGDRSADTGADRLWRIRHERHRLGRLRDRRRRRGRHPAGRDDQLHRLVQPVPLHRGPGVPGLHHALPPARPVRLPGREVRDRRRSRRLLGHLGRREGLDVPSEVRDKWSDGQPITAEDVAWTANTTAKYASGPTAVMAPALAHLKSAEAPDPTTVVLHYKTPVGNVLAQLEQFFVVPEHVWSKFATGDGKGLKTYAPENDLSIHRHRRSLHTEAVREEGNDRLHPGPELLGREGARTGGRADLLHERGLDDRRHEVRPGRLGRPGAVQRGRRAQEGLEHRRPADPGRGDHEHHLELQPVQGREPRAPRSCR